MASCFACLSRPIKHQLACHLLQHRCVFAISLLHAAIIQLKFTLSSSYIIRSLSIVTTLRSFCSCSSSSRFSLCSSNTTYLRSTMSTKGLSWNRQRSCALVLGRRSANPVVKKLLYLIYFLLIYLQEDN